MDVLKLKKKFIDFIKVNEFFLNHSNMLNRFNT